MGVLLCSRLIWGRGWRGYGAMRRCGLWMCVGVGLWGEKWHWAVVLCLVHILCMRLMGVLLCSRLIWGRGWRGYGVMRRGCGGVWGGVMGGEVTLGGGAVFGAHFVQEAYGGFVV